MSFWRTFGFHTVSAVETILDRDSFTLDELLDEEEILQEVKSQNKKLLDFLTQPATLLKLFEYITKDPPEDADPKRRFKYPFLACEIVCSEIWALTESIFRDESLLDVLFSYLDKPPPLNPLLASYTSRVAIVLLSRRTTETLAYIRKKENIIAQFITHLGSASVMELLLKIIGSEESPEGSGILQWLCSTELVPSLLSKFDPELDENIHENVGQTLADIINISSHIPQSPLLAQLESEQFVSQLFKYILSGSNSVMLNGLGVVIELLRRHGRDSTDDTTTLDGLPPLLATSVQHLSQFDAFLKTPYPGNLSTQNPPLGFYRLKVIDFYLALLRTRYRCVDEQFVNLKILDTCLELFFTYQWNNFLHASVEQIIYSILEGRNDELKLALLNTSSLLNRIVEANQTNINETNKPRSARLGYMGFLTNISLSIANAASSNPKLEEIVRAHSDWMNYVNTSLTEIRTIETKPLGGHRPMGVPGGESSEEEEEQHDSIFDRYKLGFTDDFPEEDGNEEYDEGDMTFDTTGFSGNYHPDEKNFELYNDENNENLGDAGSDDSDEEADGGWVEKKIADVGSSPSEGGGHFPNHRLAADEDSDSDGGEDFGDFVQSSDLQAAGSGGLASSTGSADLGASGGIVDAEVAGGEDINRRSPDQSP